MKGTFHDFPEKIPVKSYYVIIEYSTFSAVCPQKVVLQTVNFLCISPNVWMSSAFMGNVDIPPVGLYNNDVYTYRLSQTEKPARKRIEKAAYFEPPMALNCRRLCRVVQISAIKLFKDLQVYVMKQKLLVICVLILSVCMTGCTPAVSSAEATDSEPPAVSTQEPTSRHTEPDPQPSKPLPSETLPDPSLPPTHLLAGVPLSSQEMSEFAELFAWFSDSESDAFNYYNTALCQTFISPEMVDISLFLSTGIRSAVLSTAEIRFAKANGLNTNLDIGKVRKSRLNALLEDYFGISYGDTQQYGMDRMLYNKTTGCYYTHHVLNCIDTLELLEGVRTSAGLVQLRYRANGLPQEYIVTLKDGGEDIRLRYKLESNLAVSAALEPDPFVVAPVGTFSSETLSEFDAMFAYASSFTDTWYSQALSSIYSSPKELDVHQFFYNGFHTVSSELADWQVSLLSELGVNLDTDVFCLPKDQMNDILLKYFGLTLKDMDGIGLKEMTYAADMDSYFISHGDVNYVSGIAFTQGEKTADGVLRLYYTIAGESTLYVVTMREITIATFAGSQVIYYRFLSNLPAD